MQVLELDGEMLSLAEQLKDEQSLLVFGRGYNYATALEAALKVCALPQPCHRDLSHPSPACTAELDHMPQCHLPCCL